MTTNAIPQESMREMLVEIVRDALPNSKEIEKVIQDALKPVTKLETLKRKPFLTTQDVEDLYGVKASSLRTWRCRGGGPEYHQPTENGTVTYTHEAIQAFLTRSKIRG